MDRKVLIKVGSVSSRVLIQSISPKIARTFGQEDGRCRAGNGISLLPLTWTTNGIGLGFNPMAW